jgi:hypothetical protein
MTWSTLVLSHPPLKVEIIGTLGIRLLFFLAPSILFIIFDSLLPSLAVGIKRQGAPALPTRTGGVAGTRRGKGRPQWYQVIGLSIFNVCLGVAIQALIEVLFTEVLHIRSALKVTTTLPMPWSIAKNLVEALVIREVRRPSPVHSLYAIYVPFTDRIPYHRSLSIICTSFSTLDTFRIMCATSTMPISTRFDHLTHLLRTMTIRSLISYGDSCRHTHQR